MLEALPKHPKIEINQRLSEANKDQIQALDALLVFLPASARDGAWPGFPHAEPLSERFRRRTTGAQLFFAETPDGRGCPIALGIVGDNDGAFEYLTLARKLLAGLHTYTPTSIGVLMPGLSGHARELASDAAVAATIAASFSMPELKKESPDKLQIQKLEIFGLHKRQDFSATLAAAEGTNLARWLTGLPGNYLTPGIYRDKINTLAKEYGWTVTVYDEKKLKARNAGAFLAVTQASEDRDAAIVHLRYEPKSAKHKLALVGKGLCFDTGGSNLKSAKSMYGMHGDMQGSAVALGTLVALTRLESDAQIDCWMALAQNHTGPRAYKPNDVVTASNGVTIEVVHTDAEGRMALADTLVLACENKPDVLIDYATLTGACVNALGNSYSGAFVNRPELISAVIDAGNQSGERVWPFPTTTDFDEALESEVADIKQCVIEGTRDHILAARFLSRFVDPAVAWTHVDLSASDCKNGLAHVPTEITGFGVRFSLNLLADKRLK
ncbi:MAG: leucyl aminopeptidase family protein [Gammaproteobacteria bacterium]